MEAFQLLEVAMQQFATDHSIDSFPIKSDYNISSRQKLDKSVSNVLFLLFIGTIEYILLLLEFR